MAKKITNYLATIRSLLERTKERSTLDAHYSSVRNPDGSVDGEIRFTLPKDGDARDTLLDVESWIPSLPSSVWISVGSRFAPTDDLLSNLTKKNRYQFVQGMIDIGAYSQRGQITVKRKDGKPARVSGKAYNFTTAREIVDAMIDKTDRVPKELFVRLSYTPSDTKPARRGRSKDVHQIKKQKSKKGRQKRGQGKKSKRRNSRGGRRGKLRKRGS